MRAAAIALFLIPTLWETTPVQANCQVDYRQEIQTRTEKLSQFKHAKKRAVLYSFLGAGIPVGVAMGYLFYQIADGATIAAGALGGGLFGGAAGGVAAGAVFVPMEIIQLVKQSRLRAYVSVNSLLEEAAAFNPQGHFVNQLLRNIHSAHPEMDVADLIAAINAANASDAFCDGTMNRAGLAKPGDVRKYFKK